MKRLITLVMLVTAVMACGTGATSTVVPTVIPTPTSTPDIDATVQARVAATELSKPTATASSVPAPAQVPTETPSPTSTPVPTPTATTLPTPRATVPATSSSNWDFTDTKDPFSGKPGALAILPASSGIGLYGDDIYLVLRCKAGTIAVLVNWNSFLTTASTTAVKWRVGNLQLRNWTWDVSTSFKTTIYSKSFPSLPTPVELVRQLATSDRFVVEVVPFGESPLIAVFDLENVNEIANKVLSACDEIESPTVTPADVKPSATSTASTQTPVISPYTPIDVQVDLQTEFSLPPLVSAQWGTLRRHLPEGQGWAVVLPVDGDWEFKQLTATNGDRVTTALYITDTQEFPGIAIIIRKNVSSGPGSTLATGDCTQALTEISTLLGYGPIEIVDEVVGEIPASTARMKSPYDPNISDVFYTCLATDSTAGYFPEATSFFISMQVWPRELEPDMTVFRQSFSLVQ